MIQKPMIPMTPEVLPKQRVYEVVDLPERPAGLTVEIGYYLVGNGVPQRPSRDADYLGQCEWAWSPMHSRIDAYYLHRGRTHWSLWWRFVDDDGGWTWCAVASCQRTDVSRQQAAVYLLMDYWRSEARTNNLDEFHWINETGLLSVAELMAIAREVWRSSGQSDE